MGRAVARRQIRITMGERTRRRSSGATTDDVVTYEDARVIITPEGPRHFQVVVSRGQGHRERHAVERVVINTAEVRLDSSIWFIDAKVDVGVAVEERGETVWVWA
jgi:hypothetical protein